MQYLVELENAFKQDTQRSTQGHYATSFSYAVLKIERDHLSRAKYNFALEIGCKSEIELAKDLFLDPVETWKVFDIIEAADYLDMTRLRNLLLTHTAWCLSKI